MNRWPHSWRPGLTAVGIVTLLGLASADVGAQSDDAVPLAYISLNRAIIVGQVQLAIERERHALAILPTATDQPTIKAVLQMVYESYVLVRYAVAGTEGIRQRQQYPNPLLKIQLDMMEVTRGHLRECMIHLDAARVGQLDRVPAAVEHLRRALERLEGTAELMS